MFAWCIALDSGSISKPNDFILFYLLFRSCIEKKYKKKKRSIKSNIISFPVLIYNLHLNIYRYIHYKGGESFLIYIYRHFKPRLHSFIHSFIIIVIVMILGTSSLLLLLFPAQKIGDPIFGEIKNSPTRIV